MTAKPFVVAIDQGTTSTRALTLDASGESRITAAVEHRQSYPQPGWVEHDPLELVRNIESCLAASHGAASVAIDNQGESCLAWDTQTKEPLSPVIVWQDSRTQDVVDRLKAAGMEDEILRRSGLPLDSYFSASKLAWLYRNVKDAERLRAAGRLRLGTTDAFFLDRLTGRCVTDITTASRTSLLNIREGAWDSELCRLFEVPADTLPDVVDTTGDFGALTIEGEKVPLTVSIVDQQAALYGHGCRTAGDAKVTFGTGAFALMVTGPSLKQGPAQGLLPTIAWRKRGEQPTFALDGAVYTACAAVNWARSLGLFESFDQINHFDGPAAIEQGIAFVPALTGLACPHWNRDARGAWFGLSLEVKPLDMVRAVLEGVALRTAEVIDAMDSLTPIKGDLSVDGGLCRNPYFCQFLADVLDRKVLVATESELTAVGAALLATEACGMTVPEISGRTHYAPRSPIGDARSRFNAACDAVKALAREGARASSGTNDVQAIQVISLRLPSNPRDAGASLASFRSWVGRRHLWSLAERVGFEPPRCLQHR